jgi:hypothetical protein
MLIGYVANIGSNDGEIQRIRDSFFSSLLRRFRAVLPYFSSVDQPTDGRGLTTRESVLQPAPHPRPPPAEKEPVKALFISTPALRWLG